VSWILYAAVFGAFFLTHSLPVRPGSKRWLVKRLGPRGFTLSYSILSLAMLAWLIVAAANAPYVALWDQATWQRHVIFIGMFAVSLLVALSIARPNPFSFGGARNERFDPKKPGLIRWTRHPLLLALTLWSALHILPNGDVAHVILFGVFALFGLFGMRIVDRRKQRLLGDTQWQFLRGLVAAAPLFTRHGSWLEIMLRLTAGVSVFALLLVLHPIVLGVSPLP
tara:strand:- start:27307 stop:27978 length:672 start_codon:yes stop_codon:yes gene_type:complete